MPNETSPLIRFKRVTKRYGWFPAIQDLTCELFGGQIVAILGANGSGKSTLLKLCAGLLRPNEGNVQVGGWHLPKEVKNIRAHIGYVGHELYLDDVFTVRENLCFFASCYGLLDVDERVDGILNRMEMERFADSPIRQLSRGKQQLLNFIRAGLHEPEILLCDEPLIHLDAVAVDHVLRVMQEARSRGCLILWVTHDYSRVAEVADRKLLLHSGKLLFDSVNEGNESEFPNLLKELALSGT